MGALEVILILLAITIIIISSIIVEKEDEGQGKEYISGELNNILDEVKEETIEETEEYLSRLSNEKIISVTELSDQVLEKIKNNHEEVIFMYNMLNDKEKELKKLVTGIDLSNKIVNNEEKQLQDGSTKHYSEKEVKSSNTSDNNNEEILTLHSQGKSINEIAKMLNIGRGEVSLVINLFKGK